MVLKEREGHHWTPNSRQLLFSLFQTQGTAPCWRPMEVNAAFSTLSAGSSHTCVANKLPNHRGSIPEHVVGVERRQPVAVRVSVVVTGSSAVTLDEGDLTELFQTGTRRGQRLPRALRPHPRFLKSRVKGHRTTFDLLNCCAHSLSSAHSSERFQLTITKE